MGISPDIYMSRDLKNPPPMASPIVPLMTEFGGRVRERQGQESAGGSTEEAQGPFWVQLNVLCSVQF